MAAISSVETTGTEHEQPATSYLLLRIGHEFYGLPSTCVREIMRWRTPTPIPGAPDALPGIISQRGFVMPVVSLHPLLGLQEATPARNTRYVIIQWEDVDLAVLADAVLDLVSLSNSALEPLPAALDPQRSHLLSAIAQLDDHPMALLDLAAIIATLHTGD